MGDSLTLRCLENNLFRNNQGVQYPYAIGDVGQIYTSFYGTSYYYYFYNWKIKKQDITCVSDRVPVAVTITGTNDLTSISDLKFIQIRLQKNYLLIFIIKMPIFFPFKFWTLLVKIF